VHMRYGELASVCPTAVSYCNANRADEAVRGLHIELCLKSRRCARTDREAGDADTDGDEELGSVGWLAYRRADLLVAESKKNPPTRRIPRPRSDAIRVREGGRPLPR
jgi:hypothetical protein